MDQIRYKLNMITKTENILNKICNDARELRKYYNKLN